MADDFLNPAGLSRPATDAFLITGNDSANLAHVTRGISFVTAGDLKVVTAKGNTVVIPSGALAAGLIHPLRVSKVFLTGTTAAGIVGYY